MQRTVSSSLTLYLKIISQENVFFNLDLMNFSIIFDYNFQLEKKNL